LSRPDGLPAHRDPGAPPGPPGGAPGGGAPGAPGGAPGAPDAPVFAEPWEAQAFALAVKLSAEGHFTWQEWSAALAEELRAAAARGAPDDGSHYYRHWLAALERLVTAKGLTDAAELRARKDAWADAYRRTPHGTPVELRPGRPQGPA
jgi:nitrile hydratase accessory protein